MTTLTHALTPEAAAAKLIGEALRAGATPDCDAIGRTTGLTAAAVSGVRDRLVSGKRGALIGLLSPISPAPEPTLPDPRWQQALDHPNPAAKARARALADSIAEFESWLEAYDKDLRLEAELQAQLEVVRRRIGQNLPCKVCGRPARSERGLRIHMSRVHLTQGKAGEAMPHAG